MIAKKYQLNNIHDLHQINTCEYTDCPPKKNYNRHMGIDCEEPFMESEKSNRIMKL